MNLGGDLLLQRQRRRPSVGGLGIMLDDEAARFQPVADLFQEYVAARLSDIENADPQALQAFGSGQALPDRRTSLRGRVEKYCHLASLGLEPASFLRKRESRIRVRAVALDSRLRGSDSVKL